MKNDIRDEIIELASGYAAVDRPDFPLAGDLFSFEARTVSLDKVLADEEGWRFTGYGQCRGYVIDEESRPRGKWVYFHYLDLARFPLVEASLKLQPPHITSGRFSTPDRTVEVRIRKCRVIPPPGTETAAPGEPPPANVVEFPIRK